MHKRYLKVHDTIMYWVERERSDGEKARYRTTATFGGYDEDGNFLTDDGEVVSPDDFVRCWSWETNEAYCCLENMDEELYAAAHNLPYLEPKTLIDRTHPNGTRTVKKGSRTKLKATRKQIADELRRIVKIEGGGIDMRRANFYLAVSLASIYDRIDKEWREAVGLEPVAAPKSADQEVEWAERKVFYRKL